MRNYSVYILFFFFLQSVSYGQDRKIEAILEKADKLVLNQKNHEAVLLINETLLNHRKEDRQTAYLLFAKARAYSNTNQVLKAIHLTKNALQYPVNEFERASFFSFIGYQYSRLRLSDECNQYLEKAESIDLTNFGKDSVSILNGGIFLTKGFSYKENISCDLAVSYFNKAILEFKKNLSEPTSVINLLVAYNEKGFCHLSENEPDSANLSFGRSLHLANDLKIIDQAVVAKLGIARARIYQKDFEAALALLKQVEDSIERVSVLGNKIRAYETFCLYYLETNDLKNYVKYNDLLGIIQKKFERITDKNFNEALLDTQKEFSREEKEEKNFFLILLSVILLTGLIIVLIITAKIRRLHNEITKHDKKRNPASTKT